MGFERIYDYSDVLTIKRFNECDKFFRLLMGPFGSGKSSGCWAEIIDRGMEQQPSYDGVRRTKWAVVRNCYDDQTEVLTEAHGWKLFKDVLSEDKIATLNNEELTYQTHNGVAVHRYDSEMFGFESEGVDFLVTPDHWMYVSRRKTRKKIWDNYEFVKTNTIYNKYLVRVKRDAVWNGGIAKFSEDIYELIGYWFAEGSYGVYGGRERFIITTVNDIDYARNLFRKTNIKYVEWNRGEGKGINFVIRDESETAERIKCIFRVAGKSIVKKVPNEILSSPAQHLRSFLVGYWIGDGCHSKTTPLIKLITASKNLADDLQEIALKVGMVGTVHDYKDICHVTLVGNEKYNPYLHVIPNGTNHLKGWYKQQYDGFVYCLQMPLVPIYVRRNGKAFWCGRTYKQLIDTTQATCFYWLPPDLFGNYNKTEHRYVINKIPMEDGTRVEIEVIFRALDKELDVRNLLSLELTGAWFNEVREISRFIVNHTEGRCRRYPKDIPITWTGVIADTNPPDQYSWIYKFFEETVPKDEKNEGLADRYEIFKQPSGRGDKAENLTHLDGGRKYYTDLAIGKDPEFIKVYCDGEYGLTRDGKPVYRNYMDSIHCAKEDIEPIKGIPIIASYDFGHTPGCVFSQYLPGGGFNVLKEFWSENSGIRGFVGNLVKPYILAKYRGFEIITTGDRSGIQRNDTDERNCFIELKAMGYPATPSYTNDINARINAVDVLLTKNIEKGKPAFQISPSCELLRRGFISEYKYHIFKGIVERVAEKPEKDTEFSHVHDALQYAALLVDMGGAVGGRGLFGSRYDAPAVKAPSRTMYAWT